MHPKITTIPSYPLPSIPQKKEIQIPKECVLSRSLFPTYLIPRSAVAADRVNLGWCLFRVRCRGVGFGRVSCVGVMRLRRRSRRRDWELDMHDDAVTREE